MSVLYSEDSTSGSRISERPRAFSSTSQNTAHRLFATEAAFLGDLAQGERRVRQQILRPIEARGGQS
jgi:hypothetical protein